MGAPQISSLHTILGPPDHFLRLVSSHTIWGPLSDQFHWLLYAPPPHQISFFACYRGAITDFSFFTKYMGGPPQISFSAYYMGPLRLVSLLTIWGLLISVSVHTFWGPLSDQFFSLTIWGPLRSVSSHTIWGAPQISFFTCYMGVP